MDTIILKYNAQAKPILTDRNGEAIVNWVDGGNHSMTASATQKHSGTRSFELVASGAGDFTTNYESLASGNNATFVLTQQYGVVLWAWSASAIGLFVQTGGTAPISVSLPADSTWHRYEFIFTASSAATALKICLSGAATVYIDDITVSGAVSLNVLSERGMSDPDMVNFFPGLQYNLLDGTIKEYINGFRRKILVDVGVVAAAADRKCILYWMADTSRVVDYLTEYNIPLALEDVGGYENKWDFDCSLMRHYSFALKEPSIRSVFPV